MKKFVFFVASLFIAFAAQAQTVEHSKVLENTYVTIYGGAITSYNSNLSVETVPGGSRTYPEFWDRVAPVAGIEFGKYVTPVIGFGLEGLAMFNTTGSNTFVDQTNVVGNLKLNLSNLFGGYPGEPRRVEVVLAPGLGWGHDYGDVYHDRNYLTYNAAAELNINLDKARAFQLNVKPAVVWNNYNNALRPMSKNIEGRVLVGLTYKFGSKSKKSHNFVLCHYSVKQADYDALQSRYNDLAAKKAKVDTVVVEKVNTVVVEKIVEKVVGNAIITFPIGSSYLYDVEKVKVKEFVSALPKDTEIVVIGSADTKTGSTRVNERLSKNRAETVAGYIINVLGVSENLVKTTTKLDIFENEAASRAAVISAGK